MLTYFQVSFLAQTGGRSLSDFIGRAMSQIMVDDLCNQINWSGLHKTAKFKDLSNIIKGILGK